MSCSGISGGKCQQYEPLVVYISPVIPEALEVLYGSGCSCFLSVTPFATKSHYLEGPQAQGRILYLCIILKAMKAGKGDALRQEQGLFCILFVAAWTKRMASGGTRPAGYAFGSLKNKKQQINDLLLSGYKKEFKEVQFPIRKKNKTHMRAKVRFVNNLKNLLLKSYRTKMPILKRGEPYLICR